MDKSIIDSLRQALIDVAIIVEDDGKPCWCCQLVAGGNEHSAACLNARKLTEGVEVREATSIELVNGKNSVLLASEPAACPKCGSTEYGRQIPTAVLSSAGKCEQLCACVKCGTQYVRVYRMVFVKNVMPLHSAAFSVTGLGKHG